MGASVKFHKKDCVQKERPGTIINMAFESSLICESLRCKIKSHSFIGFIGQIADENFPDLLGFGVPIINYMRLVGHGAWSCLLSLDVLKRSYTQWTIRSNNLCYTMHDKYILWCFNFEILQIFAELKWSCIKFNLCFRLNGVIVSTTLKEAVYSLGMKFVIIWPVRTARPSHRKWS